MSEVLEYVSECADRGDLAEFLERNAKVKKCIYHGDNGLDLYFRNGKIVKVTHEGIELNLVLL
jgi:hypothetical protein